MCLRIIGAGAVRGHVPVPPAARGWKEPRNDQSQPYDAGNPAAGKDYTPVGRSDNGSHPLVRTPPRCWALVVPDRRTVDHPLTRPGNPDASLSAFWRGSGAGARRASDALGGSAGSDLRQREGRYGVPLQRNRQDSRYCPDRTGGRSLPDGGSGRSGTGVQCSPSAQKADEDLIVGQKREIVNRPCFARPLGCGIGVMCKIETRYRTCLNGAPCLPHYRPSVTHLGFGISAAKLPDLAPFAIYARVLAAIYTGPCRRGGNQGMGRSFSSSGVALTKP